MSCYFIISVFLEPGKDRADYDDYIKRVRPIVEEHGGIEYIGKDWHPDRFIMIWFPDRESIDRCFSSEKYRKIMSKRKNTVDSQAIIVTAEEMYGDNSGKRERRME